jgi:hypothetical protein
MMPARRQDEQPQTGPDGNQLENAMCCYVRINDNGNHDFHKFPDPTVITPADLIKIAGILGITLSDEDAHHTRSILISRGRRSFTAQARGGGGNE